MVEPNTPGVYTSRGPVEGEDWPAVAAALNERMAARRVGQQDLATLSGVSVSTVRKIQHGAGHRTQNATLAKVSRALDWPEGYLADVLMSGQQPPPREQLDPGDTVLEALHRVEERLREMSQQLAAVHARLSENPSAAADQAEASGAR